MLVELFPRRFLESTETSCDWGIATFDLRVLVNIIIRLNLHHRKRQYQGTKFSGLSKHQDPFTSKEKLKKRIKKGYQLTQPPCWIGRQFKSYQNIIQSLLQVMASLLRLQTSPWVPMAPACVHMPNGGGNFVVFLNLLEVDLDGPMLVLRYSNNLLAWFMDTYCEYVVYPKFTPLNVEIFLPWLLSQRTWWKLEEKKEWNK